MALRYQGFSPENIFQERDNLRRFLFYQGDGQPLKEKTELGLSYQVPQDFFNSSTWNKVTKKRVVDPLTGSFFILQEF